MNKNVKGIVIKLIIGIAVVAGIWYLVKCQCINFSLFTKENIREFIQSFGVLAPVVYIIAYILNTISILPPIAPLSLTAGLVFGSVFGSIYLMTAAMIGTTVTFFIARFFGRGVIDKLLKGKAKNIEEKLGENGFFTVLFFRLVPIVPYEALNYVSGLAKIKFKDYFLATFLGLIPGVIIATFLGDSLGDWTSPKFILAIFLMVVMIAVPTIYQIIKKKKEQKK